MPVSLVKRRSIHVKIRRSLFGMAVAVFAAVVISVAVHGQAPTASATGIITGVVQGASGPEAGVWVIAETKDLPTNFIKIVVTDDRGRFLLPELPNASYNVWVRGYGLVDSKPQPLKPSTTQVTLRVNPAKTPQEAAQVYPGNYWLSMLEPPAASEFPGTGPQGNGLGTGMLTQAGSGTKNGSGPPRTGTNLGAEGAAPGGTGSSPAAPTAAPAAGPTAGTTTGTDSAGGAPPPTTSNTTSATASPQPYGVLDPTLLAQVRRLDAPGAPPANLDTLEAAVTTLRARSTELTRSAAALRARAAQRAY